MVTIHPLDHTKATDRQRFVRFPFLLYNTCPGWVPPLLPDAYDEFHPEKHPFFEHSSAQLFLAEENGTAVGRIAVMDNQRYNKFRGDRTAFFGFFDAGKNPAVSEALFEAAFEWARSRGLHRIIGPRGLMGSDSSGILVEGFQYRAAMGLPYNFDYYDDLFVRGGFQKDTDHLSGYLPGDVRLPDRLFRIAKRIKQRRGFQVKSFQSKAEMRTWVPRVRNVHREAFANSHTFYPPTEAEMDAIASTLISVADPRLIKLVLSQDELVGFIFAYHDLTAAIQKIRGRIWPLGWLRLLLERRRANWVNINGVGVLPKFQGMGVNAICYTEIDQSIKEIGFKHMEIIQVNEVNFESRSDMETMGVEWYKRHRSYQRDL